MKTWASTSAGLSCGWSRRTFSKPSRDEGDAAVRELTDRSLPTGLVEETQRLHGEVVVLLVEAVPAVLGQREQLGRTAAPARRPVARLARLDRTLVEELVEVAPHGRRGQLEPLGEAGRGRGAVVEDRPDDALTRRLVVCPLGGFLEFHNTSVPLIREPLQVRPP